MVFGGKKKKEEEEEAWEGILVMELDHTSMQIGCGTIKGRRSTASWSS